MELLQSRPHGLWSRFLAELLRLESMDPSAMESKWPASCSESYKVFSFWKANMTVYDYNEYLMSRVAMLSYIRRYVIHYGSAEAKINPRISPSEAANYLHFYSFHGMIEPFYAQPVEFTLLYRSDIFAIVNTKTTVFWHMTPCSLVHVCQCFRGRHLPKSASPRPELYVN